MYQQVVTKLSQNQLELSMRSAIDNPLNSKRLWARRRHSALAASSDIGLTCVRIGDR